MKCLRPCVFILYLSENLSDKDVMFLLVKRNTCVYHDLILKSNVLYFYCKTLNQNKLGFVEL